MAERRFMPTRALALLTARELAGLTDEISSVEAELARRPSATLSRRLADLRAEVAQHHAAEQVQQERDRALAAQRKAPAPAPVQRYAKPRPYWQAEPTASNSGPAATMAGNAAPQVDWWKDVMTPRIAELQRRTAGQR